MAPTPLQLRLVTRPAGVACAAQYPSRRCTAGSAEAAASWAVLKVQQRLILMLWLVTLECTARCERVQAVWSDISCSLLAARLIQGTVAWGVILSDAWCFQTAPLCSGTCSFCACCCTGCSGGAGGGLSGCRVPIRSLGCQRGYQESRRAAAIRGCALARSACRSVAGAQAAVAGTKSTRAGAAWGRQPACPQVSWP